MSHQRTSWTARVACAVTLLPLIAGSAALAESDNYVEIARGKALATAGDCVACHTAKGGAPFSLTYLPAPPGRAG